VRRSWVAIVTSGAIGWASAALLALGLDGWKGDTGGLSGRGVTFTVLFTMLAAVGLDFVARPGTLARGDRAGLLILPHPLRDVRRRIAPYTRYREIAAIARRNGLHASGRHQLRLVDHSLSVAIRKTLEQAGIVFVKLGQMASTREDLLPPELTTELRHLQSRVEPLPQPPMQEQLEAELGGTVEDHFTEFEWRPIGSASVAQAYTARLPTGEPVIVKVQRPGMDELVARDGATVLHLARALEQRTPIGRDLHAEELAEDFVRAMKDELDFVGEAANAVDIAAGTDGTAGVRIPRVFNHLVTRRVLVEERFEGKSVTEPGRIAALGLDPTAVADRLVEALLGQVLYGHFHADPHPGNVMLLDDGSLGLIDFGMTGRLDANQRSALMDMMASLAAGDPGGLRDAIEQVAVVGADVPDADLERALGRFLSNHLTPGHNLGPEALNEIVALLSTFDIRLPKELTMSFRALAMLDGTAKAIDPGYALVPALRRLLGDTVSPTGPGPGQDLLHDELLRQLPRLRRLPAHLERIASSTARGQLRTRVSLFSVGDDVRVFMTAVNRLVLGLTGGLVLVGSALLLAAAADGPSTSLPEVFGYVGLAVGGILVLRVVAAVVRDGYG
jgi:ubiquinone biosynthesis protein